MTDIYKSVKEPDLEKRVTSCIAQFSTLFSETPTTISRAPGRAEILGCHTDYNWGYALAAGITRSTIALLNKRQDNMFSVYSNSFPLEAPLQFSVDSLMRDEIVKWPNYIKAVLRELLNQGFRIGGANILIDSTVPKSGGVSSSAALELAVAYGLLALYNYEIDVTTIALLCKTAENSDLVLSPCGFLDQGASAFAKDDGIVFMDFLPSGSSPVSAIDVIPARFPTPCTFIIPVDPSLERQLGESGYVVRRKLCEESWPFWTKILGREIKSLRDVTYEEFEMHSDDLETYNPIMRKRVEHIITENKRVLDAITALKEQDLISFGRLLTDAGKSSLELYELDENTPQLTFLVEKGRELPGVVGMRNMGGGFSAIALALVEDAHIEVFMATLSELYQKQFGRTLEFIDFTPSNGAQVLLKPTV